MNSSNDFYFNLVFTLLGFSSRESDTLSAEILSRGGLVDEKLSTETDIILVEDGPGNLREAATRLMELGESGKHIRIIPRQEYHMLSKAYCDAHKGEEAEGLPLDTSAPRNLPTGGGNLPLGTAAFSLLGLPTPEKISLINYLTALNAKIVNPGETTQYLICHPDLAKESYFWQVAKEMEARKQIYILPPLVLYFWTNPNLHFEKLIEDEKNLLAVHYMLHEADWQKDQYGNCEVLSGYLENHPHDVVHYLARGDLRPEMDSFLNWLRRQTSNQWMRYMKFHSLRLQERISLAINYLKHTQEWDTSSLELSRQLKDFLKGSAPLILNAINQRNAPSEAELYLNWLNEQEKTWTEVGYSDGFYTYTLVEKYYQKAIEDKNFNQISFYLNYKATHYDDAFIEDAEMAEMDVDFGLCERPPIYHGIGRKLEFGHYPQSDFPTTGDEPIRWRVIAREGDRLLLFSEQVLESLPYHKDELIGITWENCSLRAWLNETFYHRAFSPEEQEQILESENANHKNFYRGTLGGNPTKDRIFLLSIEEMEDYLPSEKDKLRYPTNYCKVPNKEREHIIRTNEDGACFYWLRSPGTGRRYAASVDYTGYLDPGGRYACAAVFGVCPAVWIKEGDI